MKKSIVVFCLLILSEVISSQIYSYSAQPAIDINEKISMSSITLDFCKKELGLSFFLFGNYRERNTSLIVKDGIYKTNIFYFQEIIFKKVDKYRLIILNNSLFFNKNDLLYCHSIDDCNFKPIENCIFWDKGMRNGNWQRYIDKGIITTVWRKGRKMKEFFKTYEEIENVSSKLPQL